MARRVRQLASSAAFVEFEEIPTAQYVHATPSGVPTIVSLYNVDSASHRDTARMTGRKPWRELYRAKRTEGTERRAVRRADAVSPCRITTGGSSSIGVHASRYWCPTASTRALHRAREAAGGRARALLRAVRLGPNLAGLMRYLNEAWPLVAAERPRAQLRIAGPRSTEAVRDAAIQHERVEVLGFVDDLVAELASTRVVVAPLWVGGGTRLKVLEALAAARPVVGTPVGVERIGFEHDRHGLIAETPEDLAKATVQVLADARLAARYATQGRRLADDFRWEATTAAAAALYGDLVDRRRSSQR
jgi:hypothetical protein